MIIVVGGSAGSGKSTLAKGLSDELNYGHVSAGKIMREMAGERGMSLLEFSEYAENHPDVDREIDERQKGLVKDNCVVDGRLSAHFIDADFKIFLTAPLSVRAERIAKRDNVGDARTAILDREESERKRYRGIYGIDIGDLSVYDMVMDTGKHDAEETLRLALSAIEKLSN